MNKYAKPKSLKPSQYKYTQLRICGKLGNWCSPSSQTQIWLFYEEGWGSIPVPRCAILLETLLKRL